MNIKKIVLILCISTLALVACGDAKPTKEQTKDAVFGIFSDEFGSELSKEQSDSLRGFTDCVVDNSYDDLSVEFLKKIVDSKDPESLSGIGDKDEEAALEDAAEKCEEKLEGLN